MDITYTTFDGSVALDPALLGSSELTGTQSADWISATAYGTDSTTTVVAMADIDVYAEGGNDQLTFTAQSTSTASFSDATGLLGSDPVSYALIDTASGDDSLYVNAYSTSDSATAFGVDGYSINTGDGSDSLQLGATANGADAYAVAVSSSELISGSGDDTVNVWTSARGETWGALADTAVAVALEDSTLSTGDGSDQVNLSANAQGLETWAIGSDGSSIDLGSGDDQLNVWAWTTDTAYLDPAYGAIDTTIDLGSGDDRAYVSASANGADGSVLEAGALLGTDPDWYGVLDAGDGENNLSFQADARAQQSGDSSLISEATATGVEGYAVLSGEGQDWLNVSVNATGDVATAYGTYDAILDSGDAPEGRTTIWYGGSSSGGGWSYDTLNGDQISVNATANGADAYAVGVSSSELISGSGDDTVNVWTSARGETWGALADTAVAVALEDSTLSTGDGSDQVNLNANAQGLETWAIGADGSSIDLGSGDDQLNLTARTTDTANLDPAYGAIDTTIDLGSGDDRAYVSASANGADGSVLEAGALLGTDPDWYGVLDAGDGENNLSFQADARAQQSGDSSLISEATATGVEGYAVLSGEGQDWLNVSVNATGDVATAYGTYDAILDSGDAPEGRTTIWYGGSSSGGGWSYDTLNGDQISVNATANGADAYAVGVSSSELISGSGDDTVNVWTSARGETWGAVADTAVAVALEDSTLSTGDGSDQVNLNANAQGLETWAIGADGSSIDLGSGDDQLNLTARTTDTAYLDPAYGAIDTTIDLGSGDDRAYVSASANGADGSVLEAGALLGTDPDWYSVLDAGSGDDDLSISAEARAQQSGDSALISEATATGVEGYAVLSGEGQDWLNVWVNATGDVATAYGTYDAILDSGNAPEWRSTTWMNNSSGGGGWSYDTLNGDQISVGATANGADAYAVGVSSSELISGSGDDMLNVWTSAMGAGGWGAVADTAVAVALEDSTVNTGAGGDELSLSANARGLETWAIAADGSSIDMGSGDDELNLWANTTDTAYLDPAIGALNTVISLGSGDDWASIGADAEGNLTAVVEATGLDGSTLNGGSGFDSIDVSAWAGGDVASATGVSDSSILLGNAEPAAGNGDALEIWTMANGVSSSTAIALDGSTVTSGSGADLIDLSATAASNADANSLLVEQALAVAAADSRLSTGAGNDLILLNARASGATTLAIGALNSTIDTGTGDDSLMVDATTNDNLYVDPAIAVQNSSVVLGEGSDAVRLSADGSGSGVIEATGLLASTVLLEGGNDDLNITASARSNDDLAVAVAVDRSQIQAGDGNDSVRLQAFQQAQSTPVLESIVDAPAVPVPTADPALALRGSSVDLGTGDDRLTLEGGTVDSSVLGGMGQDLLRLQGVSQADLTFTRVEQTSSYDLTYNLGGKSFRLRVDSVEKIETDNGSVDLDTTVVPVSEAPVSRGGSKSKKKPKPKPKRAKKR